ncbi:E3 ubiquitin-protein ligase TRIM17-like [Pomacea canaliculata]|uniref:E3 ubiquitin-protein ligase TRIM17-like n=1 Tax=Pomacea canaliculata TaxID=400727 RepID=UPI000D72C983|nr:E3 ubiquitin-protein ligase TRIM17-like [Pomacea canaliculata]
MDATEAPLSVSSEKSECPICLSTFTEPKIMFCGHIVCRFCLITWLQVRGMNADCPLCRHAIVVGQLADFQTDHLAEHVADSLPTDHVLQAIARGTVELTPDTCQWCENLLCSSLSSPHPNCPVQQHSQTIDLREEKARAFIDDMSHVLQVMLRWANDTKKALKDTEEELRGRVDFNEIVTLEQEDTLDDVTFFQSETDELCTVLMTHQRLLRRVLDSRQVAATILLMKPMHNRVQLLMQCIDFLNQSCFQCCQKLRPSLEAVV